MIRSGFKSLSAVVLGFLLAATAHADGASVTLHASPDPVQAGSPVSLSVDLITISDLYAWQFTLNFDPTLLQASGVSEGAFLSTAGATFFIPGAIDNSTGVISFNVDTLQTAIPGANGSGTLLTISFNAVASGTSALSFGDTLALDSQGNDIAVQWNSGSLTVVSTVPEPVPALMLAAGLLVVGTRLRRRATQQA